MNSMFLPFLTGMDNLLLGGALGLLPMSTKRRIAFAATFAAAEFGMTSAGLAFGGVLGSDWLVAGTLLLSGIFVLIASARGQDLGRFVAHPAALVALPLAFSLDNLAAGARVGADAGPAAVMFSGAVSATMAVAGLFLGGSVGVRRPKYAPLLAGIAMLALSVHSMVEALS